jgi:hypothetical protein
VSLQGEEDETAAWLSSDDLRSLQWSEHPVHMALLESAQGLQEITHKYIIQTIGECTTPFSMKNGLMPK